jgi:hypothetical protein
MTNKRKQNNGHRILEVLSGRKGTSLSKTACCQCPVNLQPYYERLMFRWCESTEKKTTWAASFLGLHTGWKPYRGNWRIAELGSAKPRLLRKSIGLLTTELCWIFWNQFTGTAPTRGYLQNAYSEKPKTIRSGLVTAFCKVSQRSFV